MLPSWVDDACMCFNVIRTHNFVHVCMFIGSSVGRRRNHCSLSPVLRPIYTTPCPTRTSPFIFQWIHMRSIKIAVEKWEIWRFSLTNQNPENCAVISGTIKIYSTLYRMKIEHAHIIRVCMMYVPYSVGMGNVRVALWTLLEGRMEIDFH